MKKKIILIGAFLSACLAFGKTNAQDFVDDSASFVTDYKGSGKTIRIHSGETKKLISYISLVSKQEAENRKDVRTLDKDKDYLLEKINNELEKTCYATNKFLTSSDTIFIQADSIIISKAVINKDNDGNKNMRIGTIIYDGVNGIGRSQNVYTKGLSDRLTDAISEIVDSFNELNTYANGEQKCKKASRRTHSTGLVWGYGYLNWANGDFFSTPASNDSYNLKWSNRWDIMFRYTFLPDNPVSVTTGIGYQSNVFNFDFETGNAPAGGISLPDDITPKKYKLVARYITVPLIANFRLAKNLYIHAGVIGGLNYRNSHTGFKTVYNENGEKKEAGTGSRFKQFNTFKAEALLGIEFGGWTFYASHNLTDIFEDTYEKSLKPFSFGIMIDL